MSFGLTPAGFVPQHLADIVQRLNDDFRTNFGQNVQLGAKSVNGQIIGIMAERFADLWAAIQDVYSANYVNGARGTSLDDLFLLAGLARNPATFSLVTLQLTGVNGTLIPAGSSADDNHGNVWLTTAPVTIAAGVATVTASPASTGPITGLATTINHIHTPITGWTTVSNALDAVPGTDVETDAKFLSRGLLAIRAGGGSSAEVIRAFVLRLPGVTECAVIENNTNAPDSAGRPAHSFEVAVRGGVDQAIIDRIWFAKPTGAETFGNQTGTAIDARGSSHTIHFTRPPAVNIWMDVIYSVESGFTSDEQAQMLAAILAFGNTYTMGKIVAPFQFEQQIKVPNVDTLIINIALSASPIAGDAIAIPATSLAAFDSSRITFHRTN